MVRFISLMHFYEWETWPGFYNVNLRTVKENYMIPIIDAEEIRILTSPVKNLIPPIGLRCEFKPQKKAFAYSYDTEPCDQVVQLAKDSDVLLHDATGESMGHSSAAQAGIIAQLANTKALYFIHYPKRNSQINDIVIQAKHEYSGPVIAAQDYQIYRFDQVITTQ